MFSKKVSVIVPVFNAAMYLNKCIESIINQTYKNIELILINDGSTDESGKIIDEYAKADKRIVTMHKENGGIGSAYKKALSLVSGDYISFVDSDDYISKDMYESLVETVMREKADIIQFGMMKVNLKGEVVEETLPERSIIKGNDNILKEFFTLYKTPSLACRLFDADLFKDIEITHRSIGIDETTIIQVLIKCQKLVSINKSFYYVYLREGSVSREKINTQILRSYMEVYKYICNFFSNNKKSFEQHANINYLKYLLGARAMSTTENGVIGSKELKEAMNDFKGYYEKTRNSKELKHESVAFRIGLKIFYVNPSLYIALKSILNDK
ncbi:glycosyltransferase family 2 protein [Halobacillus yeomjeoni]|uniref:Glycosyltransferase family 2 protein n=1 Tax=Halobacillus yeomjeoni TaxID=311194 RepID=A0A931HX15_9BACI|nr:glycosyltransferase family 2 protein [Halobacillus yeomjeoni]MBH0230756.1 glycosyltransferase family 2 protein [Halobacillus yeomjeoni]